MDHHFSKRQYFINCSLTIFFSGLFAAAYFDISTCPYVYERPSLADIFHRVKGSNRTVGGNEGTAPSCCAPGSSCTCFDSYRVNEHGEIVNAAPKKSLSSSLAEYGGITCHMVDIVVWGYIIGLCVFMTHKYITYRLQGLHYFFLDYCYFHNACIVLFLLWRLVDVQWSDQPLVSWAHLLPTAWRQAASGYSIWPSPQSNRSNTGPGQHPLVSGAPLGNRSWAMRMAPAAMRGIAWDGLYWPVSVDVQSCGYVLSQLTEEEVLSSFVVFFTLLTGTFGPLLGAILMWHNALLFHSFDRMSSCYLHLAPGIVQGLLLHRLFTAARREIRAVDASQLFTHAVRQSEGLGLPIEALLPGFLPSTGNLSFLEQRSAFSSYAAKSSHLEALCGKGTLCFDLHNAVTYRNLLRLHFLMFCVWQLFYHSFSESRRRIGELRRKRKMRLLTRKHNIFMHVTGTTGEDAELLRPVVTISEGLAGNPADRVTAYTWMMEHPPGGKNGLPYRMATLFGSGRLPTTIMYQIMQWLLHWFFFTCSYPLLYASFHYFMAAWPMLLLMLVASFLCIFNAAKVNKRWIQKLQTLAEKGMQAEVQKQEAEREESKKRGRHANGPSAGQDKFGHVPTS